MHHQDVSLENLFLCEDHCLKLVDMGQAVRFYSRQSWATRSPLILKGLLARPFAGRIAQPWLMLGVRGGAASSS